MPTKNTRLAYHFWCLHPEVSWLSPLESVSWICHSNNFVFLFKFKKERKPRWKHRTLSQCWCAYIEKPVKGNIPVAVAYLCLFNSLGKYWHKEERTQLSCAVWFSFCDILAKNVSSSYSLWNKLSRKKVIVRRNHWWDIISGCYSWKLLVEGTYPWGLIKHGDSLCFLNSQGQTEI